MIQIFSIIYVGLNAFLAGYLYADEYKWAKDKGEKGWVIAKTMLLLLFAVPGYTCVFLWAALCWPFRKIDRIFAVRFFWKFYVRGGYGGTEPAKMAQINRIAKNHHGSNSLRDRIWRYAVCLLNERNGFNPELPYNEQEKHQDETE